MRKDELASGWQVSTSQVLASGVEDFNENSLIFY
jgi:hypothetical protein